MRCCRSGVTAASRTRWCISFPALFYAGQQDCCEALRELWVRWGGVQEECCASRAALMKAISGLCCLRQESCSFTWAQWSRGIVSWPTKAARGLSRGDKSLTFFVFFMVFLCCDTRGLFAQGSGCALGRPGGSVFVCCQLLLSVALRCEPSLIRFISGDRTHVENVSRF